MRYGRFVAMMAAALVLVCVAILLTATPAQATSYKAAVLADSPALYYRLDEASGTTADCDSGAVYPLVDGTYSTSTMPGAAGALLSDPTNTAATFAPNTKYVTGGTPAVNFGGTAVTYEGWFKAVSWDGQDGHNTICGVESGGKAKLYIDSNTANNARLVFAVEISGQGEKAVVGTTALSLGKWYYVAATYDGSNLRVYLGNRDLDTFVVDGTQAQTGNIAATGNSFNIGFSTAQYYGRCLNGTIDEVAAYQATLSATRLQAHFDAAYETIVPEPAGLALALLGGLGILARRRR